MLSFRSFKDLHFPCRSIIYIVFIFMYGVKSVSRFFKKIIFSYGHPIASAPFVENTPPFFFGVAFIKKNQLIVFV